MNNDNVLGLLNTLFKTVDQRMNLKVNAQTIERFCGEGDYSWLVQQYGGIADNRLTSAELHPDWIDFADFMMIIMPT